MSASRKTTLPAGEAIPVLGQGTAGMGEHSGSSRDEIAALKTGIDLGMTLIDTAVEQSRWWRRRSTGSARRCSL